jgi:hypothetical protein
VADERGPKRRQVDACFGETCSDAAAGVQQERRFPVHVDDVAGVRPTVSERRRSRSEDGY